MKRTDSNYRMIAKYIADTKKPVIVDHVAAMFDTLMLIDVEDKDSRYIGHSGFFNMVNDAIGYVLSQSIEDNDAMTYEVFCK